MFQPNETIEGVAETVETPTKGRTWPDLAHQFAIDPRYHYLILFVIFAIIALSTGRLNTVREATALVGVTVTSWIILYFIQRKGETSD